VIVPLSVQIVRLGADEHADQALGALALVTPPLYHVRATLLDTDKRRVTSYELHSMVDETREGYGLAGSVSLAPLLAYRREMLELRDALNQVLGDG
jgi:hypothetical protein